MFSTEYAQRVNSLDREHDAYRQAQYGHNGQRADADFHGLGEHGLQAYRLALAGSEEQPVNTLAEYHAGLAEFRNAANAAASNGFDELAHGGSGL